jgi:hypothetical protein
VQKEGNRKKMQEEEEETLSILTVKSRKRTLVLKMLWNYFIVEKYKE